MECKICGHQTDLLFDDMVQERQYGHPSNRITCSQIRIEYCIDCDHAFNVYMTDQIVKSLYINQPQTNAVVDMTMEKRISDTADFVGDNLTLEPKKILEIGSGDGAIATYFDGIADHIDFVEPGAKPLVMKSPSGTKIEVINKFFTPNVVSSHNYDLVIFKQVLEHTLNPLNFIADVVSVLQSQGMIYCEVPNLEFILKHGATQDFHIQHVQYFTIFGLIKMFKQFNLTPRIVQDIKIGHDFGILFSRSQDPLIPNIAPLAEADLVQFFARIERQQGFYQQLREVGSMGPLFLYGATSTALEPLRYLEIDSVVDDAQHLTGWYMPSPTSWVQIASGDKIVSGAHYLISAYLHGEIIAKKIRSKGGVPVTFSEKIYSDF